MILRTPSLIFFVIVLLVTNVYALELPGNDILNYFGSSCRSVGSLTKSALSDTESLVKIFDQVAQDPDCVSVAGEISRLNTLRNVMNTIENNSSTEVEIEKIKAQELEITSQMTKTTDPSMVAALQDTLNNLQVQRASLVAQKTSEDNYSANNVTDLYNQAIISSDALFKTISSNQRCLAKNPSMLGSVAALSSSIATQAYAVNPALSYGLAAATDFIGNAIDSLRRGFFNSRVRRLTQGSTALQGYMCAMEALTQRWCDVRDAENFLQFKAKYRRLSVDEGGFASVIRVNDIEVPTLLGWLNKVRTGVPASTAADANRQQGVFWRQASIQSARSRGEGEYTETKQLYDAQSTDDNRWQILRGLIIKLTRSDCDGFNVSGGSSPLEDIYPKVYSPYYLLGLDNPILNNDGEALSFCAFTPGQWDTSKYGPFDPQIEEIKKRYDAWIEQAESRVNQELTLVLQPDAIQVLTSAYEQTGNIYKISPYEALSNLIEFIESNRPRDFKTKPFENLYNDTLEKLYNIKDNLNPDLISNSFFTQDDDTDDSGDCYDRLTGERRQCDDDEVPEEPTEQEKATLALKNIFETAQLQYGIVVFQTRFEMIVRVSLNEYLASLSKEDFNLAGQLLAADSFLDVLSQTSGTDTIDLLQDDINSAKRITIENIKNFSDVFGRNIEKILKRNVEKAKQQDSLVSNVYSRNVSKICLLLSSFPVWPKDIDQSLCYGTYMSSIIPKGPNSQSITEDFLNSPFTERECGYRDFMRKADIYQDWGISL